MAVSECDRRLCWNVGGLAFGEPSILMFFFYINAPKGTKQHLKNEFLFCISTKWRVKFVFYLYITLLDGFDRMYIFIPIHSKQIYSDD